MAFLPIEEYGDLVEGGQNRFSWGALNGMHTYALEKMYGDTHMLCIPLSREECLSLRDKLLEQFPPDEEEESLIDEADFVVIASSFRCNQNHHVESIAAAIEVVCWDGSAVTMPVNAGYCEECELYFILQRDYAELFAQGYPKCNFCLEAPYREKGKAVFSSEAYGGELSEESPLKRCGYTVAADALTESERRDILAFVADNKIMERQKIVNFIDWLISGRIGNPSMQNAVDKWMSDRAFISKYKLNTRRKVNVRSIVFRK